MRETSAPPGYASDPYGTEGQDHAAFATGLTTVAECETFRTSLPATYAFRSGLACESGLGLQQRR
jgi:hypothetical protein